MNSEQREANRLKQKRFKKAHPHYDRRYAERNKIRRALSPVEGNFGYNFAYRTFELMDPRDLEPRIVGYCRGTWTLWSVRHVSHSRWAAWFRELESLHLEPQERLGWAVGGVVRISCKMAKMLMAQRVSKVDGLFRLPVTPETPVGRVHTDGRVEYFATLREASKVVGHGIPTCQHYVDTCTTKDEWTWFDD